MSEKNTELWREVFVTDPRAVKPITGKCVIWSGAKTPAGYGRTSVGGRQAYAHRVAAERAYGAIPSGMMVGHRCDTPSCVNPEHLFICTHAENMADMRAKGRSAGGPRHKSKVCPESVQHGENVGTSKLTAEQVAAIRVAYAPGKSGVRRENSMMDLSRKYGVSYAAINKIINRRAWL